ncbi:unnamed protein product [Phytophthora lilii]|uniref:Unnamed protein product n=1 Tax=Phytophthora lilii TaxID=2077276 RepID=A0A9W6U9M4_9STRA|nr:unnamed protein product [Phytophthora lilii]
MMLMAWVSMGLVDEMHHYTVIIGRSRALSTKDILANAMGTMTTMSLRYLYGRYQHSRRQKKTRTTFVQALGFKCIIALKSIVDFIASDTHDIMPQLENRQKQERSYSSRVDTNILASVGTNSASKRAHLQMFLSTVVENYNP